MYPFLSTRISIELRVVVQLGYKYIFGFVHGTIFIRRSHNRHHMKVNVEKIQNLYCTVADYRKVRSDLKEVASWALLECQLSTLLDIFHVE